MAVDAGKCENWQNGELPPLGQNGASSGNMEYWQTGELPPVYTELGATPRSQVVICG